MTASRPDNEAIFHAARDIADADRRREYIREACGGDETGSPTSRPCWRPPTPPTACWTVRRQTLPGDHRPADHRRAPARSSARTSCCSRSAKGAWARSTWPSRPQPVRRKVALKIIKPGMDTAQVIARFEAERQALALMDHPNIARVLDAGTTAAGRPYFVMELVKGVPITELLRRAPAHAARAAGAVRPGLPGGPARPSEGDHPPRHQAVERAGHAVRRQAGAQGDRLRRGQGDRPAADRARRCSPASARWSARWST